MSDAPGHNPDPSRPPQPAPTPRATGTSTATINVGDTLDLTGATRLLDFDTIKEAVQNNNYWPHAWPFAPDDDIALDQTTPWGLDRGAWASGPNLQYLYWQRINNEYAAHPTSDAVKGLGSGSSALRIEPDGTVSMLSRATTTAEKNSMNPSNQNALNGVTMDAAVLSSSGGIRPPFFVRCRAKLPPEQGAWPALWILPHPSGWPPEIDILEAINTDGNVRLTASIHPPPNSGAENFTANLPWPPGKNPTQDYIEYGGVIYDDLIAIFHDGKCVYTWPMFSGGSIAWFILLNMTVSSGGWAGAPNPSNRTNFTPYNLSDFECWQMPQVYGQGDAPPDTGGGGTDPVPPVDTSAARQAIYDAQLALTDAEGAITSAQAALDRALHELP